MTSDVTDHDIRNRDDIASLITEFYSRAFADPVLGPIFVDVARMDLEAHMPVMCDFWETVLFQAGLYKGNAFNVHLDLHGKVSLSAMHFQRWLDIWEATVDDLFVGGKAIQAKVQAGRIAGSIRRRLERTVDGESITLSSQPTPLS
ncbi:MAG: group III truncated hemoglobin [Chloroflexota bacterium]|nr:group III truncated hemoglobin [Chloroflexota bacterium]